MAKEGYSLPNVAAVGADTPMSRARFGEIFSDVHLQELLRLLADNAALHAQLAAAKEDTKRLLGFAELTMRGLAQGHIRASPFMDMSDPNATEWPMRFLADECAEVISKSIAAARKEGSK